MPFMAHATLGKRALGVLLFFSCLGSMQTGLRRSVSLRPTGENAHFRAPWAHLVDPPSAPVPSAWFRYCAGL